MIKGASFETSYIHGRSSCGTKYLDFHNLQMTKHDAFLEQDYSMLRDKGFTFFRDSCFLTETLANNEIYWYHLDKLAKVSNGQIQLSISHYEWPSGEIFRFCEQLAERYRGVFHSYIPFVESGYWAHMLGAERSWVPKFNGWWKAWRKISFLMADAANGLRYGDPNCKIAMAEPWLHCNTSFDDLARPFNSLLGKDDQVALENCSYSHMLGREDLLDIIGLNVYTPYKIKQSIEIAQRMFPGKEIMITETGNIYHQHIMPFNWWNIIENEIQGTQVEIATWSPVIQMYNFEQCQPVPGYLFDLNRNKSFW